MFETILSETHSDPFDISIGYYDDELRNISKRRWKVKIVETEI